MSKFRPVSVGSRFSYLTVERKSPVAGAWECRCVCGNLRIVIASKLRNLEVKSCGCKKSRLIAAARATHGMSATRVYSIWAGMIQRCKGTKHTTERYKARGITVCPEWLSFERFYADMGEPPEGYSIEREDNSKGYEPGNCVWADNRTQGRNRESCKYVTYRGEKKLLIVWCEELNLNYQTVWRRLYRANWDADRALSTPIAKRG